MRALAGGYDDAEYSSEQILMSRCPYMSWFLPGVPSIARTSPAKLTFPGAPLSRIKAHAMTAPCEKSRPDVRRGIVSHRVQYYMHTVSHALCSGRRERSSPSGLTFPTSTTDQGSEACKAHASVSAHVTSPARLSSSMDMHSYSTRLDGEIDLTTHFGTPLSSSTRKGLSYRAAAFEPHSKLLAVACAL